MTPTLALSVWPIVLSLLAPRTPRASIHGPRGAENHGAGGRRTPLPEAAGAAPGSRPEARSEAATEAVGRARTRPPGRARPYARPMTSLSGSTSSRRILSSSSVGGSVEPITSGTISSKPVSLRTMSTSTPG